MDPDGARSPLGSVTSTTLLQGLRDPENQTVWRQYVDRYRPVLVRFATRLGVPAGEAEDVAQASLLAFSTAYRGGKYERARGRLSAWLFGIARNEVRAWARGRRSASPAPGRSEGDAALAGLAADDELEALWERQWQDALLWECLRVVRAETEERTMRAFELFALGGRSAEEVARELDVTPNAVFGAKRRVLARVRELLPLVEDDF